MKRYFDPTRELDNDQLQGMLARLISGEEEVYDATCALVVAEDLCKDVWCDHCEFNEEDVGTIVRLVIDRLKERGVM